jgi:hypothetical protein
MLLRVRNNLFFDLFQFEYIAYKLLREVQEYLYAGYNCYRGRAI